MIRACAAYKAGVVLSDPYETEGRRAWLNLGHVRARARSGPGYRVSHGEAVALGLLAALRLSGQPTEAVEELLRPQPVEADLDVAWAALKRDKKERRLRPPRGPGQARHHDRAGRRGPGSSGSARPAVARRMQVAVLNGVNLDVLAQRDPELYGGLSYGELETRIYGREARVQRAASRPITRASLSSGCRLHAVGERADRQSGRLEPLQRLCDQDALEICGAPVVEVHLSNIGERGLAAALGHHRRRRPPHRRQGPRRLQGSTHLSQGAGMNDRIARLRGAGLARRGHISRHELRQRPLPDGLRQLERRRPGRRRTHPRPRTAATRRPRGCSRASSSSSRPRHLRLPRPAPRELVSSPIAFESDFVTVAAHGALSANGSTLVPAKGVVLGLRAVEDVPGSTPSAPPHA